MKIISVKTLAIPEIKVIKFARFNDERGYFTEIFRRNEFNNNPETDFLKNVDFTQCNESYSEKGVLRGLHFQWNPYMGKLVRLISGRMIDLALDIRKNSPTFGKIIAYDLPADKNSDYGEWIWLPPGFAHGLLLPEESTVEYFCSGEWSPECEACISPLSSDIDWSLCDPELKKIFYEIINKQILISDKDKNGLSLKDWKQDKRANNFIYGNM
ncbi:MAG: dTDP-4-dehydrorhamnose 3,5-epimerase family protein [bacterium]